MKVTGAVKFLGQIFSFPRISSLLLPLMSAGAIFFASCTKVNEFTIGENFIESQARLQVIDTFKVDLSTVLLDSVVTSSTKIGLAGSYMDEVFGSFEGSAYFDLAFETFNNLEEGAIFDSAAFLFNYSDSVYGDTTALMSLSVYQLNEQIEPNLNGKLYNTSFFDFSPVPLGTAQFYPSPRSAVDTAIVVPVNDFGRELFTMFLNKDVIISSQETFEDFLKGFVLSSSGDVNNAIIYFKADKNNTALRFYYHLDKEFQENKSINLLINETSHQFNRVKTDFTNTLLKDLKSGHNLVKSTETGNMAFIQGMSGLLAKIQFPTVQNILAEKRWKILKAELIFEPVNNSNLFRLPERLYLYDTDRANGVNSQFTDSNQTPLLPRFIYDPLYNADTRYIFDITPFINSELSDHYFDYDHGLLIALDAERVGFYYTLLSSSLNRLLIEGKNPPVKLRVYYLTY